MSSLVCWMLLSPIRIHRACSQLRNGLVPNASRTEIQNLAGVRVSQGRLQG